MGLIYLDTCVLVYAIERHATFGSRVLAALANQSAGRFAISPLVKFECLVAPMRTGNLVLQRYYEQALEQFVLLPMTDAVFLHGAQLRARFGIKTPDALHLAAAQHHGCSALWTNDERLVKAGHGLAVNVLADPVHKEKPR